MKSPITTHVLDTAKGQPAAGIETVLEKSQNGSGWLELGRGVTNDDGRINDLLSTETSLEQGMYRLTFETGSYNPQGFYPYATIVFNIEQTDQHYHVTLLLNPFGYSTYRGS